MRSDYHNFLIRGLDIIGSIVGLLLSIIPVLIIAIRIKKEDGGPIFFRQKRVGKDGEIFLTGKPLEDLQMVCLRCRFQQIFSWNMEDYQKS